MPDVPYNHARSSLKFRWFQYFPRRLNAKTHRFGRRRDSWGAGGVNYQIILVVPLAVVGQAGSKPPTSTVAVMLSKPLAPVAVTSISRLFCPLTILPAL